MFYILVYRIRPVRASSHDHLQICKLYAFVNHIAFYFEFTP